MTISSSQVEIKTRSPVWDHRNRCKCNYCAIGLKCVTTSGTSNLAKHLKTCKPYIAWQQRATQQNLNSGSGVTVGNMQVGRVSEAVFREACNEMLVLGELPLAFIESIAWRHFCRRVQLYQPHSRRTATRDIVQMYVSQKAALKKMLVAQKQRVSLTTDIWVAQSTRASYMVITCHFVDSCWRLRKLIIGFKHVLDHKGVTIAEVLLDCLAEWGIERVFTITVDNATANTNALKIFVEKFQEIGPDALVLSSDMMHVRCCAHILNLIVKDGFHEMSKSVAAVRNAVVYVRASGRGNTCPVVDVEVRVGTKEMSSVYNKLVNEEGFDETKTELDMYLKESVENPKSNLLGTEYDVLSWWRFNSTRFPVLSELAKDILAMQVSSVASESAFSTSGQILVPQRSCLTHYMIEVLMCTEQWMKADHHIGEKGVENFAQMVADIEDQDLLEKEFQFLSEGQDN